MMRVVLSPSLYSVNSCQIFIQIGPELKSQEKIHDATNSACTVVRVVLRNPDFVVIFVIYGFIRMTVGAQMRMSIRTK